MCVDHIYIYTFVKEEEVKKMLFLQEESDGFLLT